MHPPASKDSQSSSLVRIHPDLFLAVSKVCEFYTQRDENCPLSFLVSHIHLERPDPP